jgi:transposase-like protein
MIQSIQQKREKFHRKMQENSCYNILKEQDPKIVDLPIRDLHKLLKQRSQVQFSMKVRIVELRFGKYGNLRPIRMSITNIAKRVSIARSTVYKIIQKYVESDGTISALPEKQERKKIIESTVQVGERQKHITEILKDPNILR